MVERQPGSIEPGRRLTRRALMRLGLLASLSFGSAALLSACQSSPAAPAAKQEAAPKTETKPTSAPAAPAKPASAPAATARPASAAAGPATQAAPAKAQGASGRMVMVMSAEPPSLENWKAHLSDHIPVTRNVQEALLNRNPKTSELVGELAESWEQTNPTTWRFKLRDGVKFHSGTTLDAEGAAYGINWTWSKDNNFGMRTNIGPDFEAKPVDRLTLEVVTVAPDPILSSRLYFAPLPDPVQVKDDPGSLPTKPIGTGPYKMAEWVKGQRIVMTANPDWWGHNGKDPHGQVRIQEAELRFRQEVAVRASMVQAGEADFGRFMTPDQCPNVPNCSRAESLETIFLRLDTMHPAMSDLRVRKAIALAIDKQAVADRLFGGLGRPASQMIANRVTGYDPSLKPYPYDMEEAKRLVQEAKAAGVAVDAPITSATRRGIYARHDEFSEYTASQLQAIGLNAKSLIVEPAEHQAQLSLGGYDKVPKDRGWITNNPHSNEIMDVSRTMQGYYRCTGSGSTFCDPEIDKMIDAALPLSGDARTQAFQAIARRFYESYAIIPVIHMDLLHATSKRLQWQPRIDGFLMLKEMSLTG
ncbi:MAG: hypothetical protein IT305_08760 [Chloroflexi bacterium]|nr:hypothetical protein [Chloroflexota bacterium]